MKSTHSDGTVFEIHSPPGHGTPPPRTPLYARGNVVIFRSGGPKMTVETVNPLRQVGKIYYDCSWFSSADSGSVLRHGSFEEDTITKYRKADE